MGTSISSILYGPPSDRKSMRVLMLGLGDAGKTSILYKLKLNKVVIIIPTPGFNVESVLYKNTDFTIWDVGAGYERNRPLLKHCVIFVVDSCDRSRIDEARTMLHALLNEEDLRTAPLLVFANKHDIPDVMDSTEAMDKLGLCAIQQQKWHIQRSDVVSGAGLYEGLEWLMTTVRDEHQ